MIQWQMTEDQALYIQQTLEERHECDLKDAIARQKDVIGQLKSGNDPKGVADLAAEALNLYASASLASELIATAEHLRQREGR